MARTSEELIGPTGVQSNPKVKLSKRQSSLKGKKVSVLGISFKPDSDDVRESVPIHLARSLIKEGALVCVYDPAAMENARKFLGNSVRFATTAEDCLKESECCFIATGWGEFRRLRPSDFKTLMATPVVVDGRRIYDPLAFRKGGVLISTIGTGPSGRAESRSTSMS